MWFLFYRFTIQQQQQHQIDQADEFILAAQITYLANFIQIYGKGPTKPRSTQPSTSRKSQLISKF